MKSCGVSMLVWKFEADRVWWKRDEWIIVLEFREKSKKRTKMLLKVINWVFNNLEHRTIKNLKEWNE